MKVLSRGPEETIEAGRRLGKRLKPGQTVCLYGDLGAGKTTFIKGVAEALGLDRKEITSASFLIVAEHDSATPPLYHIDLYRLEREADAEAAGVFDYIGGPGVAVIEWAERIDLGQEPVIRVTINPVSEEEREIIIEGIEDEDRNHPKKGAA